MPGKHHTQTHKRTNTTHILRQEVKDKKHLEIVVRSQVPLITHKQNNTLDQQFYYRILHYCLSVYSN